jgi:transposase
MSPRPAHEADLPIIAGDELEGEDVPIEDDEPSMPIEAPRLQQPVRGRRLARKPDGPTAPLTAEQRLLLLDTWRRSGLPAGDFGALVGISKHTLYSWKKKFETDGPAGLADKPRGGPTGSRLPEVTKRAILMLKQDNPDWGCEKISAMLMRGPERGHSFASSSTAAAKPPTNPFVRASLRHIPHCALCVSGSLSRIRRVARSWGGHAPRGSPSPYAPKEEVS